MGDRFLCDADSGKVDGLLPKEAAGCGSGGGAVHCCSHDGCGSATDVDESDGVCGCGEWDLGYRRSPTRPSYGVLD